MDNKADRGGTTRDDVAELEVGRDAQSSGLMIQTYEIQSSQGNTNPSLGNSGSRRHEKS